MNWADFFIGSFGSLAATGIFMYIFREGIKAMLKKSVGEELARVSHELDVKKEIIKNDLSRDAYKTQLMLNNIHVIYPELASKLEYAFGAVSGLQGLTYAVDIDALNSDQLKKFVESRKLPILTKETLLATTDSNRDAGVKAVKEALREDEITQARIKCHDANDYRILKSIYCSDAVLDVFDACYKTIWSALVDLDVGRMEPSLWRQGSSAIRKEAPGKMDTFRKAIRSELRID
jgi:hypothetical protein